MRRSIVLAIVMAVVMAMSATALGQTDETADDATDRPVGRLWAFGSGTAGLDVERGIVRMWIVGDVTITGPARLDVRIDSWATDGPEPANAESDGGAEVILTGFAGSVLVRGADYSVEGDGVIAIKGAGRGTAGLDGTGLWRTRRDRGEWPETVSLGDG
jgi:hypothetical protein